MLAIQKRIESEKLPVKMLLQVHDELVFETPKAEVEAYAEWICQEMSGALELDVPVKADVSFGPTWLGA
jgi:DNA polymerase-1